MKIETLNLKRSRKKIAIGLIVIVGLVSVITLTTSRAKYKYTESIPLVSGTVSYKPYDFRIVAMYSNETGEYQEIDVMPDDGYTINEEKSYCTIDGANKDVNARLYTSESGEHVISNLTRRDKCYLYFDKVY